ncbi:pilus assembly PilX N-terminal domain-containing protein [Marinobacterium sp. MBR-109]|jgi:hypothetical protein|uniref:pilus assembly PilX family protein n=1 Tax=Marinobacterium sp. MBR-109 TaxID=3156462 RepID=UPI00339AB4BF
MNSQMCENIEGYRKQRGSVLVIGMIFLVVLMLGAVVIMQSSVQDEQISGNTRRSSDAFLASEAGMKEAVDVFLWEKYQGEDSNPPTWFYYSCDSDELVDPDGKIYPDPEDSNTELFSGEHGNGSTFTVNYGGTCTVGGGGMKTVSLVSTGEQAASLRYIHFNVSHDGEATWPAVFVNDNPDAEPVICDFDFGPSNSYLYDGKGGPALSTNTTECAEQIRNSDADADGNASGQLVGGVVANNPAPDFTDPNGLREFFVQLEAVTDGSRKVIGDPDNNAKKDRVVTKNHADWPANLGTPGDPSSMETTIVYGNLDITGSLEGAGVLVVTGRADFGGTPHWDGIIIVLGGEVNIGGGGTANGLSGTMIVSNIDFGDSADSDGYLEPNESDTASWSYDADEPKVNWDVSGGGNALYNYGCQNLIDAADSLAAAGIDEGVNFPAPASCPEGGAGDEDGSFGTLYAFDWFEEVNN